MKRSWNSVSGQMLLIGAVLICVLIGIAIPVVIYMNHIATRSVVITQQRERTYATEKEGLAYASHVLSSTATWRRALQGLCPSEFSDTQQQPRRFRSSADLDYSIRCIPATTAGTVGIDVYIYATGKEASADPLTRMAAMMARRSLGALSQEGEGFQRSAAVHLQKRPDI